MIKIDWIKAIGRILIAVGIVGGVESFFYADKNNESGFAIAAVAMIFIILGAFMMECRLPKKKK
ncbi:MAG: hypothetical protein KAS16_00795 [Thermoplasmata archaeon]|nr:hypothetical protein [Thermoplasmata archaeon]